MRLEILLTPLLIVFASPSATAFAPIGTHAKQQQTPTKITLTTRFALTKNIDREVYRPEKVQDDKYDVVVIGSGIGGLTAASLIAQAGKKVLVLEQHYVAGGACHVFERKGYRFATGIHYVGEMGNEDTEMKGMQVSLKRLLDTVAPENNPIVWDRMSDNYETVFIGDPPRRYEIVAGEEQLQEELMKQFPNDKDAIAEYYKLARKVRSKAGRVGLLKSLPLPLARLLTRTGLDRLLVGGSFRKFATTSVQDGLSGLTANKDLQALLAYNYADYGTEPGRAPYWMQLMLATHYLDGAYYPRGGPSNIAKKIIQCITDNGGKVLVSAPVERILVDNKKNQITGVELKDGNVIESETVVSDAGFINTVSKLLPKDLVDVEFSKDDSDAKETVLHPGPTGINLFVGLNKDAKALNLPKSNVWIHPTNELSETATKLDSMTLDQALGCDDPKDLGVVFVGCPCTKDSSWEQEHPGKSAMEIISFLPFRWFERFASFDKKTRSHGPEYEAAKTNIAKKQWKRVVEILNTRMDAKLPESLDDVDFYEVGSPLTFAHYYNAERGAFYGLDNDLKRFEPKTFFLRLRPEVPEVKGLYLSGQDAMVDGLGAAMLGGLLCARKVLGVTNPISLVR